MTDDAEQFLRAALAGGRVLAQEIKRQADHEGITPKALRKARERLSVVIEREGFGKGMRSYWSLPVVPSPPFVPSHAHPERGARMGTNGEAAPSADPSGEAF